MCVYPRSRLTRNIFNIQRMLQVVEQVRCMQAISFPSRKVAHTPRLGAPMATQTHHPTIHLSWSHLSFNALF